MSAENYTDRKLPQKYLNWAEVLDFPDHITPTNIHGTCFIHREKIVDNRGSFQMVWTMSDVKAITGKEVLFKQLNHSRTLPKERPVLRGLHAENQYKIIQPLKGNMIAVLVDLRPHSSTFLTEEMITFERPTMEKSVISILLPPGVANSIFAYNKSGERGNGALEYVYTVSSEYDPNTKNMGVRFDDVELAIKWPGIYPEISDKDKALPTLREFLAMYSQLYK
jgi:dTDP-4-dehydrorhamnose 3,5-epimerase